MLTTMIRQGATLVSVMLLSAVPAAAQDYQFTSFQEIFAELDTPLPTTALVPTCISDNGVLGFSSLTVPLSARTSFLIDRTEWESFLPAGINAINASGATVGSALFTGGWLHLPDGTTTTLTLPDGRRATPRGISADGTIVGSFSRGATHGFILDDAGYTEVDYPGAISTLLYGVNASGTMVGYCILPGAVNQAFVRDRQGTLSPLNIPGANRSQAVGINNRGQIVGNFRTATTPTQGFVYERGEITVIDMAAQFEPSLILTDANGVTRTYNQVPGSTATTVVAINTRGDIVVSASSLYALPSGGSPVLSMKGFVGTDDQGK